ncbi:DNA polymerase III PolC-type [mine drainage metagenome]|uniref:DNA polymerase III PolC-type n=1 Tax=mine drainage metagenome TaxID=410659 RepID=A0A1J5SLL4_9ZZZZ
MNLALVYDTETTGLPLFNEPSEDPRQPHIVQLAAILVDLGTEKSITAMDVIVRPDGWTIPKEVADIHGITTEHAMDVGIPEALAIDMLLAMWGGRLRIAHNETFDARIVRIALKRLVDSRDPSLVIPLSDEWKDGPSECTARMATPILKLPPTEKMIAAGRKHHKTANLSEAYRYFTGKELENAHSAMADVEACSEIYFAMRPKVAEAA